MLSCTHPFTRLMKQDTKKQRLLFTSQKGAALSNQQSIVLTTKVVCMLSNQLSMERRSSGCHKADSSYSTETRVELIIPIRYQVWEFPNVSSGCDNALQGIQLQVDIH